MGPRKKYRKKTAEFITAVQLNLDTVGFSYEKWGGTQVCKQGDWIADNAGETYTIDRESFARTYRSIGPGIYVKHTPVWAEIAQQAGHVTTKEGRSEYQAGDYICYNNEDGTDGYAMAPEQFEEMYERAEE